MVRKGLLRAALYTLLSGQPHLAHAAIPSQFVAKIYTEVLGRAPDPQEWNSALVFFRTNDCNQSNLAQWGGAKLSSQEFADLSYDAAARTLVLFRSILDREPATAEYDHWLTALAGGETLRVASAALFASQEFGRLVPFICGGGLWNVDLRAVQLEVLLDAAAPLAQNAE